MVIQVFNNNGRLKCRGILPAGSYLEDCTDCSVSTVQSDMGGKPVEGIPEQYRDTNHFYTLSCGCCSYRYLPSAAWTGVLEIFVALWRSVPFNAMLRVVNLLAA